MKYVNKGNLVALLFVTAFAGDIALADGWETKPDQATFATQVREEINAHRAEFYQTFLETARNTEVQAPQVVAVGKSSIYFSILPRRGPATLIF